MQHADDGLGGLLAGHALDRQGHGLAGALLALVPGLLLDLPDQDGRLALGVVLHDLDQLGLGVGGRQARGPLQHLAALGLQARHLGPAALQLQVGGGELPLPLDGAAQVGVQALLALGLARLAPLQVHAQLAHVVLERAGLLLGLVAHAAHAVQLHPGLGLGLAAGVGGLGVGLPARLGRLLVDRGQVALGVDHRGGLLALPLPQTLGELGVLALELVVGGLAQPSDAA